LRQTGKKIPPNKVFRPDIFGLDRKNTGLAFFVPLMAFLCIMPTAEQSKKWVTILVHILCWGVLFTLPYLMKPSFNIPDPKFFERNRDGIFYITSINRLIWVILFYVNANYLTPKLYYRKNPWAFIFIIFLIFSILLLVDYLSFRNFITGMDYRIRNFFSFNFFPVSFVLASSTAYRLIIDRIKMERREKDKVNENLKTELSFLRSQVSPHFMFNVLNNMVAMARKKSEQLEPSLIKLSSLLRYMLYETDEKVPLKKEVEYLQSYIDLQQQRFGNTIKIQSHMDSGDAYLEIEPMLLIPFVENAFKHGTGMIDNAEIIIELKVENCLLTFSVRNRFNEASEEMKDKTSGIGLVNVQRRLSLLYDTRQSLMITKQEDWFVVSLQILLC
jgi:two-component system LytT family sensor kinase